MGHDIHFLSRLERVNADQQALALRLYRDPQTTRKIIEHRGTSLSMQAERVAIALDVPGVEMSADHQRRRVGKAREQVAPRSRRLLLVGRILRHLARKALERSGGKHG